MTGLPSTVMIGSMRHRGGDSCGLRVYLGRHPDTGKQRWVTRTVHGSRRHAGHELQVLIEEARAARIHAGTMRELFERWFAAASSDWSASTIREIPQAPCAATRSHISGPYPVTKLSTVDIDDLYGHLRRRGGRDGQPLASGTVHRIHVVLHRALTQAVRWEWIWLNPAALASPPRVEPADIRPRPTAPRFARRAWWPR